MDSLVPGSKELKININESVQIDLKPEASRKRRRTDDYDYNDPFLEPFEGEFDVVELECKLENFFIYKGNMIEEPKRIARRYTNRQKKQKGEVVVNEAEQQSAFLFEFEKKLASLINPATKYKKDPRLDNILVWSVLVQSPTTEFGKYLRFRILDAFKTSGYESIETPAISEEKEYETELSALHEELEKMFQRFMECASDEKNFSENMKNFEKFKDEVFVDDIVDFLIKYIGYYACVSSRSLKHTRNLGVEYLHAMLPTVCTNKVRIKHYIYKNLSGKIEAMGYDLEKVFSGEFVRKDPGSEQKEVLKGKKKEGEPKPRKKGADQPCLTSSSTAYSPTNTFSPSFNEHSMSLGSEFNPSSTVESGGCSFPKKKPVNRKGYVQPVIPVFTSNFLSGLQMKAGNNEIGQGVTGNNNESCLESTMYTESSTEDKGGANKDETQAKES